MYSNDLAPGLETPPWEAAGPLLDVPPDLAARALPSRRLPGPPPCADVQRCWNLFLTYARTRTKIRTGFDVYVEATREAIARIENDLQDGSPESDVVLLAAEAAYDRWLTPADGAPFVDFLVASKGLPYALGVLLELERVGLYRYSGAALAQSFYIEENTHYQIGEEPFGATELALRAHLAHADGATYNACVAAIGAALPNLVERRRPLLGVLLPDLPALSNQLALACGDVDTYSWLRLTATDPASIDALRRFTPGSEWRQQLFYSHPAAVMTLVMERGVDAVDILRDGAFIEAAATGLACIGTPASMTALARACNQDKDKDSLKRFAAAAQRWPLASIAALSELVAIDGRGPPSARGVLTMLARANATTLAAFAPWISEPAARVLDAIAATIAMPVAAPGELPQVLAAPPWHRPPRKAGAALTLAPLSLAPVERRSADERTTPLAGVVAACIEFPAHYLHLGTHIGAIELAAPMANALGNKKTKGIQETARAWLLANPEHAACALIAPALGKAGAMRTCAGDAMRLLAAAGHVDLLVEVAGRYPNAAVATALRALLDEDPLDIHPTKPGKLPDFWRPLSWARPVLKSNGKAVPDASLDDIGIMLRFSSADAIYPGVARLKEACTPESLADFAWDAFLDWLEAGGESKDNWVFTALGLLGNDDTARKLTPIIRAWPGQSQSTRAAAGLDVLTAIGTDTALMLLNGIAQKLKFKGLQDKAREKIKLVAQARELTTEELEDRLAPDLGLDDDGSLLLDFGARQFRVAFDEALKPVVRDGDGARLADLPKPNKTDDKALAAAAVARFKLLKADARTIAAQQVRRLEAAMCAQRRWHPHQFQAFLAGHPLLRHLVTRLVWGAYHPGATLPGCFRVAADGGYTTGRDDAFVLPQGDDVMIGVVHRIDMSDADAEAFAQLFADYDLLQPFVQLQRTTFTMTPGEQAKDRSTRWDGVAVTAARILGLENKGWRRAAAADGGAIWSVNKAVGPDCVIELHLDPGFYAGTGVDGYQDQTLREVRAGRPTASGDVGQAMPLSMLGRVAASELIRDLESLRQP